MKDIIEDIPACSTIYHSVLHFKKTDSRQNLASVPPTFLSVSTEEYSALGKRKAIVATRICIKGKASVKQTIVALLEAIW